MAFRSFCVLPVSTTFVYIETREKDFTNYHWLDSLYCLCAGRFNVCRPRIRFARIPSYNFDTCYYHVTKYQLFLNEELKLNKLIRSTLFILYLFYLLFIILLMDYYTELNDKYKMTNVQRRSAVIF